MPVSATGHAILLMLALVIAPHRLLTPAERVMTVQIVTVDSLPPAPAPSKRADSAPVAAPLSVRATAAPAVTAEKPRPAHVATAQRASRPGQRVEASDFFAAGILDDPSNADLRRSFSQLAGSEQLIQMCNIEALEQLGRDPSLQTGPAPDVVVGYAFGDLEVSGTRLVADGGAYRRQGAWYRVRLTCTANAQLTAITAFDYTLGESIPESEWEEHALNADDDAFD